MKFIKSNGTVIILVVVLCGTLYNSYQSRKANEGLFNAYEDSMTLINKQISYINELTTYIKQVNEK